MSTTHHNAGGYQRGKLIFLSSPTSDFRPHFIQAFTQWDRPTCLKGKSKSKYTRNRKRKR